MREKQGTPYVWLLAVNLFISTFTFGGGYVVIPMVRKYFVEKKQLFSDEELTQMAAIAQSMPGAIAINLSALAGYRVAGVPGAVISCLAAVIPPLVILAFVSFWYDALAANRLIAGILQGMQAAVAALIVDLVIDMTAMIVKRKSVLLTVMIPASFIASFVFSVNVAVILTVCCCICLFQLWLKRSKGVA